MIFCLTTHQIKAIAIVPSRWSYMYVLLCIHCTVHLHKDETDDAERSRIQTDENSRYVLTPTDTIASF